MMDLKSWLTGFAVGLAGKPLPQRYQQKQLVGYSYNGYIFPALPELPEAVASRCPYLAICSRDGSQYPWDSRGVLIVSSKKPSLETDYKGDPVFVTRNEYSAIYRHRKEDVDFWEDMGAHTVDLHHWGYENIIWSNFDILDNKGNVWLAASEPDPVYE